MARSDAEHVQKLYRDFYAVVRRIPPGRVATYGQIAELAGRPGAARAAGAAMRGASELGLPWHRVVGKRSRGVAQVSIHDPIGAAVQRQLLEAEGVVVSERGAIALSHFGWLPGDDDPPAPKTKTARPKARRNDDGAPESAPSRVDERRSY